MYDLDLDYDRIKEFIEGTSEHSVIMIGCDSVRKQIDGKMHARYATVICVRKASAKGVYHGSKVFAALNVLPDYGKVIKSGKMANLKHRMMQEVTFALQAFDGIADVVGDREIEIHLDISTKEECGSNVALNEARGYVVGMTGKEPLFKPVALAASFAADAHAHGLLKAA